MSKSTSMIVLGLIIVLVVAGTVGGYLIFKSKTSVESEDSSLNTNSIVDLIAPKQDKTHQDESGFSFSYPGDIILKDETPADSDYYSFLTLSRSGEKAIISAADTKHKKVSSLLGTDIPSGAQLIGAITLGGISASQYVADDKTWTVAIDQGVLYVIQTPKNPTWDPIHEKMVSTFTFGLAKSKPSSSSQGSSDDVIYETEEVVE